MCALTLGDFYWALTLFSGSSRFRVPCAGGADMRQLQWHANRYRAACLLEGIHQSGEWQGSWGLVSKGPLLETMCVVTLEWGWLWVGCWMVQVGVPSLCSESWNDSSESGRIPCSLHSVSWWDRAWWFCACQGSISDGLLCVWGWGATHSLVLPGQVKENPPMQTCASRAM